MSRRRDRVPVRTGRAAGTKDTAWLGEVWLLLLAVLPAVRP